MYQGISKVKFGLSFNNFEVKVWEPPNGYHVHGIIGMDLLRFFNIFINMDEQIASIECSKATKSLIAKKP